MNIKIITPAIAKRTSANATSTTMSSELPFPPLSDEPELVLPVVVPEVVAVETCVAVAVAVD
jgi:hypothetical protein